MPRNNTPGVKTTVAAQLVGMTLLKSVDDMIGV